LVADTASVNSTPLITVPRTLSIQFGTRTMFPLKSAVIAPEAFEARSVKLNAPDPEGVPVTAPVEVFKEIPVGSEPTLTEYVGLCVAATASEYALPCKNAARVWSTQTGGLLVVPL
jgi:hypothetical protein